MVQSWSCQLIGKVAASTQSPSGHRLSIRSTTNYTSRIVPSSKYSFA
jgi:hypothetical protein